MTKDKDDEGKKRKRAGIKQVSGNNKAWMGDSMRRIAIWVRSLRYDQDFVAELFKMLPGMGSPTHSNAWGALTNQCKREQIIVGTGRFQQARTPTNHAHKYEIYRRAKTWVP